MLHLRVFYFLLLVQYGKIEQRIIGGIRTDIKSVPYQVSLQTNKGHRCGGVIISNFFILTAAHCVADQPVGGFWIRAGSTFHNRNGTKKRVCYYKSHPQFNKNLDYDIAVLRLCTKLVFTSTIGSIALSDTKSLRDGFPALASGWGSTSNNGDLSDRLQKVWLVTVNQTVCTNNYKNVGGLITERMLCAGCKKGLCDSCQGDSGGPLIAAGKLVGIVSWGDRCAQKDLPGVYARVSRFRKWIRDKTKV